MGMEGERGGGRNGWGFGGNGRGYDRMAENFGAVVRFWQMVCAIGEDGIENEVLEKRK